MCEVWVKLLEDRASSNKLIIVSEKDSLLDTIKSRCYSVLFHPLREEAMEKYLKELKIDKDCIGFVGFLAENAPYSITASMEGINEYILISFLSVFSRISPESSQ